MDSVSKLFELYLMRSDLRPASVRFKRKAFDYFVEWFGDISAGELTMGIAEDYRTMLISMPSPITKRKRSKVAANGYLANIKPFFVWLHRNGHIVTNPFSYVHRYRVTQQKRQTFSMSDLSKLIRISSRLWRVRICLGLLGMRRGEVLNLVVSDLKWSATESYILLQPKKGTDYTWGWGLKDHAVRMAALPERMNFCGIVVNLHHDIMRLTEDLQDGQPYFCVEAKYYRKYIALQRSGKLEDNSVYDATGNFQRSFRLLQTRAGIQTLRRFHELRASFTTRMIPKIGLERTADALGHSSVETTRKYDRRSQKSLVSEISKITEFCYES